MKEIIYQGQLDDEFEGFDEEMLFKTAYGEYWIQATYKYWYHYAYRPTVTIFRENGICYLSIDNEQVQVQKLNNVIESSIDGEFKGWDGKSVYKLRNGQKWAQSTYKYEYKYAYSPDVVIYESNSGIRMNVAGTSAIVKKVQ